MMTETVVNVQDPHPNNGPPKNDGANNRQTASSLEWIKINTEYFRTLPGLLKIAELILGIFCMSFASPAVVSGTHFFLFVATTSFIMTIVWVFVYFLSIREALRLPINWILTEFMNTGICAVLYLIAFIIQLAVSPRLYYVVVNVLAGVFGLLNTFAYGIATYLLHIEWKNSQSNA